MTEQDVVILTPTRMAFHEAGHVVAAFQSGMTFVYVKGLPDPATGTHPHVNYGDSLTRPPLTTPEEEQQAFHCKQLPNDLAGRAAEYIIWPANVAFPVFPTYDAITGTFEYAPNEYAFDDICQAWLCLQRIHYPHQNLPFNALASDLYPLFEPSFKKVVAMLDTPVMQRAIAAVAEKLLSARCLAYADAREIVMPLLLTI